ncbi:peptidoglycan DD-metalloendopeptidase family protein [Rudaea sp.]|jgi:lipoprotein NlpD|uniref:peptidoglycan DD-metalloendopeptidase family protein n=1 Tax=Rudaea sp. TaxID=2136325 RepID=UPI0039C90D32
MNSSLIESKPALRLLLSVCALWLAGCASEPAEVEDRSLDTTPPQRAVDASQRSIPGGSYHVERGDTLYSIAFKRGLDYRDVGAWNGIAPPYKILAGQELRLSPPGAVAQTPATARPPTAPVAAPVVATSASSAPVNAASTQPAQNSAVKSGGLFEDVPNQPVAPIVANEPKPESATPPPATTAVPPPAAAAPLPAPVVVPPLAPKPVAEEPAPPAKPISDGATANVSGVVWRWPSAGKVIGGFVGGDQTKQGVDIAGNAGDPVIAAADGDVVYSGNGLLGYGELIIVKHNASFLSAYGHNRKRLVQEGEKVRAGQQIAEMGSSASSRDELHFEIRKNGKPVNPLDYLPAR